MSWIIFLSLQPTFRAASCTAEQEENTVSLLQRELQIAVASTEDVPSSAGSSDTSNANANASVTSLSVSGVDDLNLCMSGQLAPELFVMGFQKSGTSSFCAALKEKHSQISFPQELPSIDWRLKRVRLATPKEPTIFNDFDRFNRTEDFWLSHYPTCQQGHRQVAVDCTPYLGSGWDPFGIPHRIRQRYRHDFSKLRFVVLMREPVSRMQSAFYYDQDRNFPRYYSKYPSFQSYIDDVLAHQEDNPTTPDDPHAYRESIYNMSRYDLWIENLLLEPKISPEQLIVMPMRLALGEAGESALALLADQLGISSQQIQHGGASEGLGVVNPTSHPELEDDLSASTLLAMRAQLKGAESVAKVLTSHGVGATLFGYNDSLGDKTAIAQWLEDNW